MPSPRQVPHLSLGILPSPRQCLHGATMVMVPKKELDVSWTLPAPLQCVQVIISVPSTAPEPWQESHMLVLAKSTLRLTPKTASLKLISRSMEMSRPLDCARGEPPCPPKMSEKMSPMSKPPRENASWNLEKSNPPAPPWNPPKPPGPPWPPPPNTRP